MDKLPKRTDGLLLMMRVLVSIQPTQLLYWAAPSWHCALQDFIQRLLERKPAKRLGMLAGKAEDVKRHRWFDGFDWTGLESRRLSPPRTPRVRPDALQWVVAEALPCVRLQRARTLLRRQRNSQHQQAVLVGKLLECMEQSRDWQYHPTRDALCLLLVLL